MNAFFNRWLPASALAAWGGVILYYWLSGRLATLFKEHWRAPVVAMFHTLGALKNRVALDAAELEQQIRVDIERRTMATADRIVAAVRCAGKLLT